MTPSGGAKVEPDGTGNTSNTTGVLKLTEANVGSVPSMVVVNELDPGETVSGFEVNFQVHIGRGSGADGMSFFFGDFSDATIHTEEGPGTMNGLSVIFDVFNSATVAGVPDGPSIDVKWNNQIIAHRLIGAASATTGAAPIGTANTIRTQTGNTTTPSVYVPVKIRVETDGRFSLAWNNVVVYTNLPIFRPITDFSIGNAGARFGIGARTGGSADDHWIDNLNINTDVSPAGGQPFITSLAPIALLNQNSGAPASPIGGAIIRLRDGAAGSVNPSTVQFRFNNNVVTHAIARIKSDPALPAEDTTVISYVPATGVLAGGNHTFRLDYSTTTTPAQTVSYTYTAVVAAAAVVPTNYIVASVDLNSLGFKGRVYRMDVPRAPGDQNVTPVGERQVNLGYIDPTTGEPYVNSAILDPLQYPLDANGFFSTTNINFNQTTLANGGNIHAGSNPPRPDEVLPGTTDGEAANNIAYEFVGYIYLPVGGHRLGVHADDRIRLSLGPAQQAAGTPALLATTGANTETFADLLIAEAGYYPIRIGFWEGGGDARIELYSVDVATGQRILLNDPEDPRALKVYRDSTVARPSIARALPSVGWIGAFPDEDVIVDIRDGAFTLDPSSVILRINNVDQVISPLSKVGNVTTIRRDSSVTNLLPPGNNNVQLIYGYNDGNAVRLTNDWAFQVAPYYGVLPTAVKVPESSVTDSGFWSRVHQIDRSLNINQGEGGRIAAGGNANRLPWPEVHINNGIINPTNGLAYPNLAQAGPNSDWTYTFDLFNFNAPQQLDGTVPITGNGLFHTTQPPPEHPGAQPEQVAPGLPGTGTSPAANAAPAVGTISPGSDNYVMEATTYLKLKAGVYVFGFNSDDGFLMTTAPNPRDTLGKVVGFRNPGGGNSGAIGAMQIQAGQTAPQLQQGTDTGSFVFSVIVPEDGVYPFRILWWQGGGGVNAELFTMRRENGTVTLVNDLSVNPDNFAAFRTYTGADKPWTRFSVSPTPYDARVQQANPGLLTVLGRTRANVGANDIYNLADNTRAWADVGIGGVVANGTTDPTLRLLLDGVEVPATRTTNGTDVTLVYRPNPPLDSNTTHTASLAYAGMTNSWSFGVQPWTTLNAADAKPASAADATARGFSAKVVQSATARPGANGGNSAVSAETHLAGTPASVAIPSAEADGRYIIPGIVNWNTGRTPGVTGVAETGNFQDNTYGTGWPWPDYPDAPVPGIPGTGLTTGDARFTHVTAEIFAYLDLPRAGYYRFGGNADDGIVVKVGTPGVTNGTVIFTQDRGAGNQDIPFSFVAPEAGLYPVRFIWYQGGGGGNVEFFSYDDTGKKIAVNDPTDPNAIKAYYRINEGGGDTVLSISRAGNGDIVIDWTNGGTLQSRPVLGDATQWTDLENDGSYTTTAAGQNMFFRVRK